ncbi:hypothetical protein BDW66DRAFT_154861 [Aspergillus desertorum]
MEEPIVTLDAPRLAADSKAVHDIPGVDKTSFNIEQSEPHTKIDGSKIKFTVLTQMNSQEYISTMGGLIMVDNKLYALSTAHGIVDCITQCGHSDESYGRIVPSPPKKPGSLAASVRKWQPYTLPDTLAYGERGTRCGDYLFPSTAPATADFPLIDMAPRYADLVKGNIFYSRSHLEMHIVNGHHPSNPTSSEIVVSFTSTDGDLVYGRLLEGYSSIISRSGVIRTRKIEASIGHCAGMSGLWVIRKETSELCGMVYAGYSHGQYLHMIPADDIFRDIQTFLGASNVKVASETDTKAVVNAAADTKGLSSSSNEDASTMPPDHQLLEIRPRQALRRLKPSSTFAAKKTPRGGQRNLPQIEA